MRRARSPFVAIALLGATAKLFGQGATVPVRTLTAPEAELPNQFTRISGIRELADGRVIVVDAGEKVVALVDLARGTLTRVGREGTGPGEYASPNRVLAAPGDTTIVGDLAGRLSKVAPNGQYAGDVAMPAPSGRNAGARAIGGIGAFNNRIETDAQGRIYRQASEHGTRQARGTGIRDSVAIQRTDLRLGKVDTAAWLPVPPIVVQMTRDGGGISPGGRPEGPYVARTTWVVAPDGRIAIVSPEPYQLTWFAANGQRVAGQPIPFQRVPVTSAEKQWYRDNYSSQPNMSMSIAVDQGGGIRSVSTRPTPYREPGYWPADKDPFGNAPHSVLASPSGEVWILRQLPHTEKHPAYDVIGARGELTGRVVIPERSRVIGFGRNGVVYVVRMDDDDLQHLQRFRNR
jgi:hypothetical protein